MSKLAEIVYCGPVGPELVYPEHIGSGFSGTDIGPGNLMYFQIRLTGRFLGLQRNYQYSYFRAKAVAEF